MKRVAYVESLGFAAPGLPDWLTTRRVLRDEQLYQPCDLPVYQPALLPPNERRRASQTVRLAFRVAEEATRASSIAANRLACVFASSDGDLNIAHKLCLALAEPQQTVSPTDFHNSVHNAAAGYWSIAALATGPSTAVAAYDYSFAGGLMEALGMVSVERHATLLIAYDVPAPAPLLATRPLTVAVGVGLVLTPEPTPNTQARLAFETGPGAETSLPHVGLEALRQGNPAARGLPLLRAIARGAGSAVLALSDALLAHVTVAGGGGP
ncbi:MAG TPA: beta-ketoacyl synthase chain length factor [Steroidobacteraceae bacterium]|nr:beta-ketoacyl synthase chain length factor [Steroidobacteraceae bacterium]